MQPHTQEELNKMAMPQKPDPQREELFKDVSLRTHTQWEKKEEMIDFLKHILPYWQAEDLDNYMYIVHHYDLERVATKFKEYMLNYSRSQMEEVKKEVEKIQQVNNESNGRYNACNEVLDLLTNYLT